MRFLGNFSPEAVLAKVWIYKHARYQNSGQNRDCSAEALDPSTTIEIDY